MDKLLKEHHKIHFQYSTVLTLFLNYFIKGGVLAHAFYPENGNTHFDDGEAWVIDKEGIDLFQVAAHEVGHALGLEHSRDGNALMAPIYAGYIPNYKLPADDIAGIQSMYGKC